MNCALALLIFASRTHEITASAARRHKPEPRGDRDDRRNTTPPTMCIVMFGVCVWVSFAARAFRESRPDVWVWERYNVRFGVLVQSFAISDDNTRARDYRRIGHAGLAPKNASITRARLLSLSREHDAGARKHSTKA